MTLPSWLLYSLMVWTLARLLIYERGPFAIFTRLRAWAGVSYDSLGFPVGHDELSYLFSCLTCLSFWLSVGLVLVTGQGLEMVIFYTGASLFINRISG